MVQENAIHANEADFENLTKHGVCAADFWADWCPPCRMLAPAIEELAAKFQGRAKVLKVNVDDNPGLAAQFAIHGVPTVVFFKDGKEVQRLVGVRPLAELAGAIEKHLAAKQ